MKIVIPVEHFKWEHQCRTAGEFEFIIGGTTYQIAVPSCHVVRRMFNTSLPRMAADILMLAIPSAFIKSFREWRSTEQRLYGKVLLDQPVIYAWKSPASYHGYVDVCATTSARKLVGCFPLACEACGLSAETHDAFIKKRLGHFICSERCARNLRIRCAVCDKKFKPRLESEKCCSTECWRVTYERDRLRYAEESRIERAQLRIADQLAELAIMEAR